MGRTRALVEIVVVLSLALVLLFHAFPASADTVITERQYQEAHHWGVMEYKLPDRTRVDDLTDSHAIEYDFAHKWAEAIGQALHYARMTGKRPGIVLIVRTSADEAKIHNITKLGLGIDVWVVRDLVTPPLRVN